MTVAPPLSTAPQVAAAWTLLLQTLPLQGASVIDVGCGDGRLARFLADHGEAAYVTGIECSPRQLAKAQAAPRHPRIAIENGVAQSLPMMSESVDIAILFNSLHHVPAAEMGDALTEVLRVVRPGGFLYINEPIAEGAFFEVCRLVDDETKVRTLAQQAIAALLATQGPQKLRKVDDQHYANPLKLPSYETFRERIGSSDSERDSIFERMEETLRTVFAQQAERDADGAYCFENPNHMICLQKVALA